MDPVVTHTVGEGPGSRSGPALVFFSSSLALSLSLSLSSGSQMWQLQLAHSIAVLMMTSREGTPKNKISRTVEKS